MAIFLRHSYNVPIIRWGSDADVQYAVKDNCEKIFGVNSDNLVLAMPMWENSGNIANDYGGNGNSGAMGSAVSWVGNTIDFPGGVNSTTKIIDIPTLNLGKENTIISEFDLDVQEDLLFGGATGYYVFGIFSSEVYYRSSSFVKVALVGTGNFALGVTRSAKEVKFYKSGVSLGATQTLNTDVDLILSSIGGYDAGSYAFNGRVKYVNFFDVALTASQVSLLNDLPYALYQPVRRPIYFIPEVAPSGIVPQAYLIMRG